MKFLHDPAKSKENSENFTNGEQPNPRYEYGGILTVEDDSPVHSIRDNRTGKLVKTVHFHELEETLDRLNGR